MATQEIPLAIESMFFLNATAPQWVQNGTNYPVPGWAFDAAADEAGFLRLPKLPSDYVGTMKVQFEWYADTATANNVVWGAAIAAITPDTDTQDIETDTLATESTVTDSHLGTTGQRLHTCEVTLSALDSAVAGDYVTLRVRRLGSNGSDTMTGDAILVGVIVTYADA